MIIMFFLIPARASNQLHALTVCNKLIASEISFYFLCIALICLAEYI